MNTIIDTMKTFGEFFTPAEITEFVEDIIGYEEQKAFLEDFFEAIKTVAKLGEMDLPFSITLSALLIGPPGTGKTTLAKAMAKKAEIPIFLVYADSLIGSILGKTLNNIRDVLNAAHAYAKNNTPLVVFFDELDAIASERSSVYEVGEIKRAVVTLLQRMDAVLGSKDPIAFLGATNHQYLLDSAVWRRFCYHISFPIPNELMRKRILESYIESIKKTSTISVVISPVQIEALASNEITGGYTGADLKRGFQIAILRALKDRVLDDEKLSASIQSAGGTQTHIDNEQRMSGRDTPLSAASTARSILFETTGENKPSNITAKKSGLRPKKII